MEIQRLKLSNINNIVNWNQNKDADFLFQWAGRGYEYPLTEEQIVDRLSAGAEIYEANLDNKMVGTIEIISREEQGVALIGRFVLDTTLVGQGLGTQILESFMEYCKKELGLRKIKLFVFDFNFAAHKCYQKCGFYEVETVIRPNGWKAIGMEKEIHIN